MLSTAQCLPETFMKYVIVDPDGCWLWTGGKCRGYGIFWAQRTITAHKWSYQHSVGPVPPGMTLDHTCHDSAMCRGGVTCPHRACVRPDHLKPTTSGDNVRRALLTGRCKAGLHEMSGGNVITRPSRRGRECRSCSIARRRVRE